MDFSNWSSVCNIEIREKVPSHRWLLWTGSESGLDITEHFLRHGIHAKSSCGCVHDHILANNWSSVLAVCGWVPDPCEYEHCHLYKLVYNRRCFDCDAILDDLLSPSDVQCVCRLLFVWRSVQHHLPLRNKGTLQRTDLQTVCSWGIGIGFWTVG